MIKVLLLHADGVSITGGERFSARAHRDFGVPEASIGEFFDQKFGNCLTGKLDLKEALREYLPLWKKWDSVDDLLAYWFADSSRKNEPVLAVGDALRAQGVKCYLVTNQEKYRAEHLWNEFGLKEHFDGKFASCDTGFMKKHPEFFEYVLRKIPGITPSEILFWDDDEENIEAGQKAGVTAHFYRNFEDFKAETSGLLK